jgi:hypothetical protein
MKIAKCQWAVALTLLLTIRVAVAYYADVPAYQPAWRGQPNTTLQKWSFSATPTNGSGEGDYFGPEVTLPDVVTNPGTPNAAIVAEQGGVGWVYGSVGSIARFSSTNFGWWDLGFDAGGSITLTIPGAVGPAGSIRQIYLQITAATNGFYYPASVTVSNGTQVGGVQTTVIEQYGSGIPDYVTVFHTVWQVPATNTSDTITITGTATPLKETVIGGVIVETAVAPVAHNVTYSRSTNLTWKIRSADLAANGAALTGDTLSIVSVSGASHGTVSLIAGGDYVGYVPSQPDQNLPDSFTYTVQDNHNGLQASATVNLNVTAQPPGQAVQISVSGPTVTVVFAGIYNYTYDVQRSTDVNFTSPVVILTTNAPPGGIFTCVDSSPPSGSAFYRLKPH